MSDISIEDVRDFIKDAEEKRNNWLLVAQRSWNEIKKRNKRNQLWGGNDLERGRRWTRYPLWWTALMIRGPIVLSRLPIPTLKDTQGDDELGRTACILGERFMRSILKTFDALPVFMSGRDDFLVTNLGWARAFYRVTMTEEEERIPLMEIQPPAPPVDLGPDGMPTPDSQPIQQLPPMYITPDGEPVQNPEFDDGMPYITTGKMVDVENEEVYLDHGLFSDLLVDPDIRRWSQVKRLAYRYEYTYRDFVAKFGEDAAAKINATQREEHKTGKPIIVYEYWDLFDRCVKWLAESSNDFFRPLGLATDQGMQDTDTEDLSDVEPKDGDTDDSDLYGLSGFFPMAEPLILNAPTDEFWPVPEYFQINDILDDVHNIVGRMFLLTKAIRIRFFFEGSIPELKQLVSEMGEGGGIAVTNLAQTLNTNQSQANALSSLVAYFPVAEMIEGLKNMYEAFNQRLDMFFQATGLNDLIRGATSDTEKTYGERQMEGKYAMNRIEPFQRQMQEWIKNSYQILLEMGFKNFSDKTIDEYITPQTLDEGDKARYVEGLEILKANRRRRFRVDFETDATIAINEQYQRQEAIDLANTLTKAMESTAKVAETQPELAATELAVIKHLMGQFANGKLFIDEIQKSIEDVIEKVQAPKPPEFNKDEAEHAFDMQKLGLDDRFRNIELQMTVKMEMAKLMQQQRQDSIKSQLEQLKTQIDQGAGQAQLQLAFTKLQADIAQGWEDLNIRKEQMLEVAQQEGGKQSLEAFRAQIDARVASQELTLAQAEQELETYRVKMEAGDYHASLQERIATEQRLQDEHVMNKEAHAVDLLKNVAEAVRPAPAPAQHAAPITIDKSTTLQVKLPEAKAKKPKAKK